MGDHQAPPVARVVAQVRDARQATPHLEHNPFSRLGICHAIPLRKLNDPATPRSGFLPFFPLARAWRVGSQWRVLPCFRCTGATQSGCTTPVLRLGHHLDGEGRAP
jgi:hypothetical protein